MCYPSFMTWFATISSITLILLSSIFGSIAKLLHSSNTPVVAVNFVTTSEPLAASTTTTVSSATEEERSVLLNPDGTPTDFAKTTANLYVNNGNGYQAVDLSAAPFNGIDLASFSAAGGGYMKDKHHVYFSNVLDFGLVPDADPSSFGVLVDANGSELTYGIDRTHVFFGSSLIVGADPSTFRKSTQNSFYDKDKQAVYYEGMAYYESKVTDADPKLFVELPAPDGSPSIYGKQVTKIFCGTSVLIGVDAGSFEIGNGGTWATDKGHSYEGCGVYDPSAP